MKLTDNFLVINDTLAPVLELPATRPAKEVVLRQNESNCAVVQIVHLYHLSHGFAVYQVVIYDGDALACFNHRAGRRSLGPEPENLLPILRCMLSFALLRFFY